MNSSTTLDGGRHTNCEGEWLMEEKGFARPPEISSMEVQYEIIIHKKERRNTDVGII